MNMLEKFDVREGENDSLEFQCRDCLTVLRFHADNSIHTVLYELRRHAATRTHNSRDASASKAGR